MARKATKKKEEVVMEDVDVVVEEEQEEAPAPKAKKKAAPKKKADAAPKKKAPAKKKEEPKPKKAKSKALTKTQMLVWFKGGVVAPDNPNVNFGEYSVLAVEGGLLNLNPAGSLFQYWVPMCDVSYMRPFEEAEEEAKVKEEKQPEDDGEVEDLYEEEQDDNS